MREIFRAAILLLLKVMMTHRLKRFMPIGLSASILILLTCFYVTRMTRTLPGEKLITYPSGIDVSSYIYEDPAVMVAEETFRKSVPSGLAASLKGTYKEQFKNLYGSFHVESNVPFIGEARIWNGNSSSRQLAVFCTVDYRQIPCSPDHPFVQFVSISPREEQHLPVTLTLTEGMHDVGILAVQDPFENLEPQDDNRSETLISQVIYNVFTGDSTQPPTITSIYPPIKLGRIPMGTFLLTDEEDPVRENGAVKIWLDQTGSPGQWLDLRIHLGQTVNILPTTLVVNAYLDYQQIPITVGSKDYIPLFVYRIPFLWQIIRAQIKLPDLPGAYTLVVTVRPKPFSRNEVGGKYINQAFTEASQRLRIEVR